MESGTNANKGWYNEGSVQRILYDLYDSNDEGSDTLSLGFSPINKVMTGAEKSTHAFTSLFTFISYLKDENPAEAINIDAIVSSEEIAVITDIYGTGRSNKAEEEPYYADLVIGSTVNVCPNYIYGEYNKLGNRKYIKFNIENAGNYTITVKKSNSVSVTDPDFYLLDLSDNSIVLGDDADVDSEIQHIHLTNAKYLLDVSDFENNPYAFFVLSVN
jgi:hypothetical protein